MPDMLFGLTKSITISGHLFQGRYGAKLIKEDAYFLDVSRYIHLNPLEANMSKDHKIIGGAVTELTYPHRKILLLQRNEFYLIFQILKCITINNSFYQNWRS